MQGWTWTSQMEIVSLLVFHGKTTNPLVMNWTFRPFWKAIFVKIMNCEPRRIWRSDQGLVFLFLFLPLSPGKHGTRRLVSKETALFRFFLAGIKGYWRLIQSDGTVVTIVLDLWKAYLFGASVLRVWFFPAKNGLNKHLETRKLQGVPGWWQWQFEGYQDGERALGEDWWPDASLGQETNTVELHTSTFQRVPIKP